VVSRTTSDGLVKNGLVTVQSTTQTRYIVRSPVRGESSVVEALREIGVEYVTITAHATGDATKASQLELRLGTGRRLRDIHLIEHRLRTHDILAPIFAAIEFQEEFLEVVHPTDSIRLSEPHGSEALLDPVTLRYTARWPLSFEHTWTVCAIPRGIPEDDYSWEFDVELVGESGDPLAGWLQDRGIPDPAQ
jgi:hypothetical protein